MPIGATIGSAVIGAGTSLLSASEQAGASNDASQTQLQMYNQTRSDLQPFFQGGQGAFSQLQSLLGFGPNGAAGMNTALAQYPGYQFAMDQGVQALDRSAASRGTLLSGGQLRDITTFGQNLASTQFDKAASQLQAVSSLGENAAAQTGSAGSSAASAAGSFQQAAGTQSASGIAGAANQLGGLLQNSGFQSLFNGTGSISDPRVKEDVEEVGQHESGLTLYRYRLRGSERKHIGVMSDEVRRVRPDAVRRGQDGFDRVDYKKLGIASPLERAA